MRNSVFARKSVQRTALAFSLFSAGLASSTPVLAGNVTVNNDIELPQKVVRFSDLDLDSSEGRAQLDFRIKSAVADVCGDADIRDLRTHGIVRACRVETSRQAMADRDMMLARRESGERVASLAISPPRSL